MRRTFLKSIGIMVTTAIVLSGCASIVSKSAYPVYIRTNPVGANISITDKKGKEVYKGQSPAMVTLKSGAGYFSKAEYQVKLSSRGYGEKIIPVYYKLNGWYFGNLLFGGVIGFLIVDPATGAMWKIADPVIDETLVKTIASGSTIPTLNIVSIQDMPEEFKGRLVRVN